jgi:hypothetical protein
MVLNKENHMSSDESSELQKISFAQLFFKYAPRAIGKDEVNSDHVRKIFLDPRNHPGWNFALSGTNRIFHFVGDEELVLRFAKLPVADQQAILQAISKRWKEYYEKVGINFSPYILITNVPWDKETEVGLRVDTRNWDESGLYVSVAYN